MVSIERVAESGNRFVKDQEERLFRRIYYACAPVTEGVKPAVLYSLKTAGDSV